MFVVLGESIVYLTAIFLVITCLSLAFKNPIDLASPCWIYVPGVLFLAGLYMVRYLRYPFRVHEARLVDRSEAEALFLGAEYYLKSNKKPPLDKDSENTLQNLITNRRTEGPSSWTEYRVLAVEQAMIRILPVEDLIARTYVRLDDLKEYQEQKFDTEEKKYFDDHINRVHKSIKEVEDSEAADGNDKQESTTESLRAELRMLLETLADYDKNWAIGSEILRTLLIVISFTVPIFLLTGIAPVIVPPLGPMDIISWALFGTAGSLTAVLRKLYLGNKVEVGTNEGKNELYRAIMGAILGLVSGFMIYMMLSGGIVNHGVIVPDVDAANFKDISLSIFWAFLTGYTFEHFFDKAVQEQIGQSNGKHANSSE